MDQKNKGKNTFEAIPGVRGKRAFISVEQQNNAKI